MNIERQKVYGANITGFEGGVVCVDCATEGPGMNTKDTYILFEVGRNGKVINPMLKVVVVDKGSEGVTQNNYNMKPSKWSTREVSIGMSAKVVIEPTSEKGVNFNGEKPPLYSEEMRRKLFW